MEPAENDVWIIVNNDGEVTDVVRPSDRQTLNYAFVKEDSRVYNEIKQPPKLSYTPIVSDTHATACVFKVASTPNDFTFDDIERLYTVLSIVEVKGDIDVERINFELQNLINTFPEHKPPKASIDEYDLDWRDTWQPGLRGTIGVFQSDWKDVSEMAKQYSKHKMGIHYYAVAHTLLPRETLETFTTSLLEDFAQVPIQTIEESGGFVQELNAMAEFGNAYVLDRLTKVLELEQMPLRKTTTVYNTIEKTQFHSENTFEERAVFYKNASSTARAIGGALQFNTEFDRIRWWHGPAQTDASVGGLPWSHPSTADVCPQHIVDTTIIAQCGHEHEWGFADLIPVAVATAKI